MNTFQKIIGLLDFAKGNKTNVMATFTVISLLWNISFNTGIDAETLSGIFFQLIEQGEIIAGAAGIVYGLFMKLFRYVR